jgi:putative spermidine/putrescine transport system permease protein
MKRLRISRLLLAGFAALVYAFLLLPLLIVFPISFSSAQYLQFPPPGW